ncbi:3D (Asp-Asp-Asp) domain-containing protein [Clostridium cavendishii DSM 21758]|uniref:3D (Asp-Asp-Asp) domain-containing protein n=1 Tax=Clostridium cavendishii DSM 21758 TaxID=1121302 RepID=A0A1M6FIC4_9CLOT|nr:3D domain-containing protein [Clostridium cavendishii]SHI97379.1 3D (Asp-Asp-Asp) domain-containing protein [Clostridium cavendishii DSM 21758]
MKKKFLSFFIAVTLFISNSFIALSDEKSSNTEEKKNISENVVIYKQLDSKIKEYNSEIASLNTQIEKLIKEKNETTEKVKKLKEKIKTTQENLNRSRNEIDKEQAILDTRICEIYKSGTYNNYLYVLVTSKNFSTVLANIKAISKIIEIDNKLIDKLNKDKDKLADEVDNLAKNEKDILKLQFDIEKDIKDTKEKQERQNDLIERLNAEKENVAKIIKENEEILISHPIIIINNQSSTTEDIKASVRNLKDLLPQLNTQSVKDTVNSAITSGISKLNSLNTNFNPSEPLVVDNKTFKATYQMVATAYYGDGTTAMGLKPVRVVGGLSTIAVDPKVIPLGSKVYIPEYGFAIASDTGGAIKGNIIDLFMDTESQCLNWGRRPVTLHIVAYPGQW